MLYFLNVYKYQGKYLRWKINITAKLENYLNVLIIDTECDYYIFLLLIE